MPRLSNFRSDSPLILMCWELSCAGGPDGQDRACTYYGECGSRESLSVAPGFRAMVPGPARENLLSVRVRPAASENPVSVRRYARQRSLIRQQSRAGTIEDDEVCRQPGHRHLVVVNLAPQSRVNVLPLAAVVSQSKCSTCTNCPVTRVLSVFVRVDNKHSLCVGYLPHDSVMGNEGLLHLSFPVSCLPHSKTASPKGRKGTEYVFKPRSNQV